MFTTKKYNISIYNKLTRFLVLTFLSLFLYVQPVWSLTRADEYALKAVFLFNLAKFVTWPDESFSADTQKFQFCLLGDTQFNQKMEATMEAETVKQRDIDVNMSVDLDSSSDQCQIVFIAEKEKKQLDEILTYFSDRPVLTVSDMEDFAEKGGMVEFYIENNRVRLAINPDTLQAVDLRAAANLLRVAKIVEP